MVKSSSTSRSETGRYEFRVWGAHKRARKKLAKLADDHYVEEVDDCYLLTDDAEWNAKVREDTLKIKQLVAEDGGFEKWSSNRHRSASATPSPFDTVFEQMRLDRPQRGKSFDLAEAVERLDPSLDIRAVFVTKRRHRYRIGDVRAEATDITILDTDEVLHTLSIEGDDIEDLKVLRKQLGLKGEPNLAVHQAIDAETT